MLLVEPTYKAYWELPGGAVESDESPYSAVVREIDEELGLAVTPGRLLAVDWVPETSVRSDGLMFVFDGGALSYGQCQSIALPADELHGWAWCDSLTADEYLSPLLARRARWAAQAAREGSTAYLENGFRVS